MHSHVFQNLNREKVYSLRVKGKSALVEFSKTQPAALVFHIWFVVRLIRLVHGQSNLIAINILLYCCELEHWTCPLLSFSVDPNYHVGGLHCSVVLCSVCMCFVHILF